MLILAGTGSAWGGELRGRKEVILLLACHPFLFQVYIFQRPMHDMFGLFLATDQVEACAAPCCDVLACAEVVQARRCS